MLKELLGDAYKDGITVEEIEQLLSGKKLVDLNGGEYVAKGKLTEKDNKLKELQTNYDNLSKDFSAFKSAKMTDAEKAAEKSKADAEKLNGILEENRKYKLKDELYNSGYSKDEVTQLLENNMSPETFAKIAKARVDDAVKKSTAKGIKETVRKPDADHTDESAGEITKEQFDKMSYNQRVELYETDRETYNQFIEGE